MTLQEMREALRARQLELQKINQSLTERRSAGKTGADLWTPEDKQAFDKLTKEIGELQENIEAEQRAVDLQAHLDRANQQRDQQRDGRGNLDPRMSDQIPGTGVDYGDRFADRDHARHHARNEERRCLVMHAWACEQRASELVTDRHRQAIADLRVGSLGGNLQFNALGNDQIRGLRGILGGELNDEKRSRAQDFLERRSIGYDANYQSWVPVAFTNSFEIAFHGSGGVLGICDLLITESADQLPWPFADDYANEGKQVDEGTPESTAGADAEMLVPKLGAFDFTSGFAKINKALLANSPFDLATLLGNALGERLNKAINRKLTVGDRVNTLGGFLSRGVQGVTTPVASPVALPKLQALIWSVISDHRDKGTLVMHDATLAAFASLADTTGQPLLNIGNGRLQYAKDVSVPYQISNYMKASTASLAANDKLIAFGNFKQLKVRIVRAVRLERFNELFGANHQAAFMANRSVDADLLRSSQTANCPVKYLQLV